MTTYKPLTPEFRKKILEALDERERELKTCKPTVYTSLFLNQVNSQRKLFKILPDGYPIPISEK